MDGEYDHLALVPDPRYAESVILTPEQFKQYNFDKETQLKKLSNSKSETGVIEGMFNFFKKTKIENSDLESMSVKLPKSGREVELTKLINDMDQMEQMLNEW